MLRELATSNTGKADQATEEEGGRPKYRSSMQGNSMAPEGKDPWRAADDPGASGKGGDREEGGKA